MLIGIILAAGRSARMGRSKALLPLASGEPFVCRIAATLAEGGVGDVVVVIGPAERDVVGVLASAGLAVRIARNGSDETEQIDSLRTALNLVERPAVGAIMVTPVDLPLFTADTVRRLVERYKATRAPIVRPCSERRHGHPGMFDRSVFRALREAPTRHRREVGHRASQGCDPERSHHGRGSVRGHRHTGRLRAVDRPEAVRERHRRALRLPQGLGQTRSLPLH